MANGTILKSKIFRISLICAFFLIAGTFSKSAFGAEAAKDPKEKAKEVIMEHISDSHSWPVALPLVREKHIPLPVILYTDKGLETFSSDKLLPEGTIYNGAHYSYKLEGNKIKAVTASGEIDEAASKKLWDFSIT